MHVCERVYEYDGGAQELHLERNCLGCAGATYLAPALGPPGPAPSSLAAAPLRALSLADNGIACAGASAVAAQLARPGAAPALRTLDLDGNPIREDGRDRLARAVQGRRNGVVRIGNHCYGARAQRLHRPSGSVGIHSAAPPPSSPSIAESCHPGLVVRVARHTDGGRQGCNRCYARASQSREFFQGSAAAQSSAAERNSG